MALVDKEKLPRLLYVGDLPIEATSGGQLLMYRLFKEYPPDKLMVIHSRNHGLGKHPDKELPGVSTYRIKSPHILGTRFKPIGHINKWISYLHTKYVVKKTIQEKIESFKPNIIITLLHGYFWTFVKDISKKNDLPYALMIHDDWTISLTIDSIKDKLVGEFYSLYKTAAECFCMSDNMVEYYERHTGRKGVVLPPLGQDPIKLNQDTSRTRFLQMGYGGSLHGNYISNFINTCHALDRLGGKMTAFTNASLETLRKAGLQSGNVEINEFVSSQELLQRLKNMDALYLPMDFSEERKLNMILAFPSKVPDYVMLKKPFFVHAPSYSSIVKWASSPGHDVGIIITTNDTEEIEKGLRALMEPVVYERAVNTIKSIESEFNHETIRNFFYSKVMKIARQRKEAGN